MNAKAKKYEEMYRKYSATVGKVARESTLEEIVAKGKEVASKVDSLRGQYLQWDERAYWGMMSTLNNELKALRCAWYAKRYGWVR